MSDLPVPNPEGRPPTQVETAFREHSGALYRYIYSKVGHTALAEDLRNTARPMGWSAVTFAVALTYATTQAGHPELIRSPKRILAHTWEGPGNALG
jgi:hypothetical protein